MRTIANINQNWNFMYEDLGVQAASQAPGTVVNIPHTWNGTDGQNGGNNYYRGVCWYRRELKLSELELRDRIFLEFKGVNSSATVYLNGSLLGTHSGGYSTFRFEITGKLLESNSILVAVDNAANDRVYPQTADFTFYGGIYRDVNVVCVPEDHFAMDDYGSCGIKTRALVEGDSGRLCIDAQISCGGGDSAELIAELYTAEGELVGQSRNGDDISVPAVHLWHGVEDPYLYKLSLKLEKNEAVQDQIDMSVGFRSFSVDPDKGFILNGVEYPLRGVCRHQDRPGLGNALSRQHHEEDIELICEVGANTLRLAHYQQDDYMYELCDRAGLVVWAEIPYISRHMKNANTNAINQMTELIHQQYNHASIVCWGLSNEITMYPSGPDRLKFHRELNELCHNLDPDRETAIACYVTKMNANRLNRIPDLVAYNLYYGWYFPFVALSGLKLDLYHAFYKNEKLGLAEYGAEGMPNLHSTWPRRGDNTEEYQAIYHEKMLKLIGKRRYLWATHLWNMFDFAADARNQGGEPGMNHKGLVTFDRRTKKDSFYLYKAYWSKESFVHICGRRFSNRTGRSAKLKIYSNQSEVSVEINGVAFAKLRGDKVFTVTIPLQADTNIRVSAGDCSDQVMLHRVKKRDLSYSLRRVSGTKSWQK